MSSYALLGGHWMSLELCPYYDVDNTIHVQTILPLCGYNSVGSTNQRFGAFTYARFCSLVANRSSYMGSFVLRNAVYFLEGRLD